MAEQRDTQNGLRERLRSAEEQIQREQRERIRWQLQWKDLVAELRGLPPRDAL